MNSISDNVIGIHQPNFIPWLGYFIKMHRSHKFVFLDDVPYSKGSYTARVKIHHAGNGKDKWLNIPIQRAPLSTPINRIKPAKENWQTNVLDQIYNTYRTAPYFASNFAFIEEILLEATSRSSLSEINQFIILQLAQRLEITTEVVESSKLHIEDSGSLKLLKIVQRLNGSTYLAGTGSQKYLDSAIFHQAGIQLESVDFFHNPNSPIPDTLREKSIVSYMFTLPLSEIQTLIKNNKI